MVEHQFSKLIAGVRFSYPAQNESESYTVRMDTKYVHQARYGDMGGAHSLRPQYLIKNNSVFATPYNKAMPAGKALFSIRGGKWYATEFHPQGKTAHSLYETRGDQVHTTTSHPEHDPSRHAFEIRPT